MNSQRQHKQKLSEIMKEMADALLLTMGKNVSTISSEAAHAVLLFASIAWNRAIGKDVRNFIGVLNEFLKVTPTLWNELIIENPEQIIDYFVEYKNERYPNDFREIVVCGTTPKGNIRVEWKE